MTAVDWKVSTETEVVNHRPQPVRVAVVRPLLAVRKSRIRRCVADLHIPFVEDLSNKDVQVSQRNWMRQVLMPTLLGHEGFVAALETVYAVLEPYIKRSREMYRLVWLQPSRYW